MSSNKKRGFKNYSSNALLLMSVIAGSACLSSGREANASSAITTTVNRTKQIVSGMPSLGFSSLFKGLLSSTGTKTTHKSTNLSAFNTDGLTINPNKYYTQHVNSNGDIVTSESTTRPSVFSTYRVGIDGYQDENGNYNGNAYIYTRKEQWYSGQEILNAKKDSQNVGAGGTTVKAPTGGSDSGYASAGSNGSGSLSIPVDPEALKAKLEALKREEAGGDNSNKVVTIPTGGDGKKVVTIQTGGTDSNTPQTSLTVKPGSADGTPTDDGRINPTPNTARRGSTDSGYDSDGGENGVSVPTQTEQQGSDASTQTKGTSGSTTPSSKLETTEKEEGTPTPTPAPVVPQPEGESTDDTTKPITPSAGDTTPSTGDVTTPTDGKTNIPPAPPLPADALVPEDTTKQPVTTPSAIDESIIPVSPSLPKLTDYTSDGGFTRDNIIMTRLRIKANNSKDNSKATTTTTTQPVTTPSTEGGESTTVPPLPTNLTQYESDGGFTKDNILMTKYKIKAENSKDNPQDTKLTTTPSTEIELPEDDATKFNDGVQTVKILKSLGVDNEGLIKLATKNSNDLGNIDEGYGSGTSTPTSNTGDDPLLSPDLRARLEKLRETGEPIYDMEEIVDFYGEPRRRGSLFEDITKFAKNNNDVTSTDGGNNDGVTSTDGGNNNNITSTNGRNNSVITEEVLNNPDYLGAFYNYGNGPEKIPPLNGGNETSTDGVRNDGYRGQVFTNGPDGSLQLVPPINGGKTVVDGSTGSTDGFNEHHPTLQKLLKGINETPNGPNDTFGWYDSDIGKGGNGDVVDGGTGTDGTKTFRTTLTITPGGDGYSVPFGGVSVKTGDTVDGGNGTKRSALKILLTNKNGNGTTSFTTVPQDETDSGSSSSPIPLSNGDSVDGLVTKSAPLTNNVSFVDGLEEIQNRFKTETENALRGLE